MIRKFALPIIALAIPAAAHAQAFGAASSYNVFVSGNFTSSGSDTEGKVAVGGNVNVSSYSIGANLTGGTQNALVAGGSVNYNSGSVKGNIVSKNAPTLTSFGYQNGGHSVTGAGAVSSAINFSQTASYLQQASTQWGNLAGNGSIVAQYGGITFTGTSNTLNVFNISASQLQAGSYYNFNIPSGSTVLFNVSGTSVNFNNTGYNFSNQTKVLWNLKDATTVGVTSLNGSILAPKAAVNGNYGAINGQLFAKSFSGYTQINSQYFTGNLPTVNAVPEPASMAVLGLGALGFLRRRRAAKK
ncbi:hypothetical protein BH11ARM2_BH11ARM2_12170 [soil metagenome]